MPPVPPPSPPRDERRRRPGASGLAVGVAVLALLTAHAASYLPFIADDALISLRYADRLLEGRGLTWNDGERLEGYSNLLWILLCAALGATGLDLIAATRVLGITFALSTLAAVFHGWPLGRWPDLLPGAAAGSALALSGSLAVWSVGGLEQPLLAFLVAWAMVRLRPLAEGGAGAASVPWLAAALLALASWTRPDGALFTAGACLGVLAARGVRRDTLRACAGLALLPGLAVLLQLAFRLAYYGDWLPNSAHAKLAFGATRLAEGLAYVGGALAAHAGLALPALLLAALCWRASPFVRLVVPSLGLWLAYVAAIGGDIFPARRHMVPAVVLLALLLADGLAGALRAGPRARRYALAALPLCLAWLAWFQLSDPQNLRARAERWEWDGRVVGTLLREAFGDRRPLVAVDAGGTLPYFSKLPAIDMLGINDRHLARNRPADFGRGHLGHELGDGAYVLSRRPDLVLFCGPGGGARPCFRSGQEMVRDPRFLDEYRLVTLEGRDPYVFRSQVWARLEGGRIGIERGPDGLSVPGWLFSANPRTVSAPDDGGRLAAGVTADEPAALGGLHLPRGRWTATAEAEGGGVRLEGRDARTGAPLFSAAGTATFEIADPAGATVDLMALPADPGRALRLRAVLLRRRPMPG